MRRPRRGRRTVASPLFPPPRIAAQVWREWLSEAAGPAFLLRPGRDRDQLESAEAGLGVPLPRSLVRFLEVTDGFFDVRAQYEYAWPLERIVMENRRAWADPAVHFPEHLLAFGGDGAGDWFCLSLRDQPESRVYHWAWTLSESRVIAQDLASFWPGWLDGSITV